MTKAREATERPDLQTILVIVGTDHHPFDRLVAWIDHWLSNGGAQQARVMIQYGTSMEPTLAEGHAVLSHQELQTAMSEADFVVCHGGPATITEARRHGHLPLCVPRDPLRGEHVDSHQQLFARRMSAAGLVALAQTEEEFADLMTRAIQDPAAFTVAALDETEQRPGTRAINQIFIDLLGEDDAPEEQERRKLTVLFVAGLGRSGSTLVERLVSQIPGHVGVGESVHLWDRSLGDDELCSCGERFSCCRYWAQVGEIAYGGWDQVDAPAVRVLKSGVDRTRFAPALVGPRSKAFDRRLVAYNRLLTRFYGAVHMVSGASVVVDASKHGSLLHVLRHNRELDLRVLHIVRDSPAVAYSWTKLVSRPESTGSLDFMPTWSPGRTARQWMAENLLVEIAAGRGVPTMRLRYEDFTAAPKESLEAVRDFVGPRDPVEPLDFIQDDQVELRPSHTVAGNPMRFRQGWVTVEEDLHWQEAFPRREALMVQGLTAPLRYRYGYVGRR